MKGPKGITCSLFFLYKSKEIGRAITLARKILITPRRGSKTKPITNNSLTSPPPKLSFLKIKLPANIIVYIIRNKARPLPRQ